MASATFSKSCAGSEVIKSNLLQKDGGDAPAGLCFRIPAFLFTKLACLQVALTLVCTCANSEADCALSTAVLGYYPNCRRLSNWL